MGIIAPYYTILILAIYVELHFYFFLCALLRPGWTTYLFLHKRIRTVLSPWSSLTSYSGRFIIYTKKINNKQAQSHSSWDMTTSFNTDLTIYDLRYGGKMAIAGKKTYHLYIGHICWVVYPIFSDAPSFVRGGPHTCFCTKGSGLSLPL